MSDYNARTVWLVVGLIAIVLGVMGGWTWVRGTGVVLTNDSGVVLSDVWLADEERNLRHIDELLPGDSVRLRHGSSATLRLRVDFRAPDGPRRYDDVPRNDGGNWGDWALSVGPDLTLSPPGGRAALLPWSLGEGEAIVVPAGDDEILLFRDSSWLRLAGPAELRILGLDDQGKRVQLLAGEIPEARVRGIALEIQSPDGEPSLVLQNATGSARMTDSEIVFGGVAGDFVKVWDGEEYHDIDGEWRVAR